MRQVRRVQVLRAATLVVGIALSVVSCVILANDALRAQLVTSSGVLVGRMPNAQWDPTVRVFSVELLVLGLVLAAWPILSLLVSRYGQLTLTTSMLIGAGAAFIVVYWGVAILLGHSAEIAGQRYWWLHDDAMIGMQYARNLADGLGLVWNAGQRVEGYTNFLWTMMMAAIHLLRIPSSSTSLPVLLIALLLSACAVPTLVLYVRQGGGTVWATGTAIAAFALNSNVAEWSTSGLETPLLTLGVTLTLGRVLQEAKTGRPRLLTYVLMGMLGLVRADGVVLTAGLAAIGLTLNRDRLTTLGYVGVAIGLPLLHVGWRAWYYGEFVPNTAILKTEGWPGRYASGAAYVFGFARAYWLAILLVVAGLLRYRDRTLRASLFLCALWIAYVGYSGGDVFGGNRVLVPILPLLICSAVIVANRVVNEPGSRTIAAMAVLIVSMPFLPLSYPWLARPDLGAQGNLEIGLLLRQNVSASTVVADFWAGAVPYFSELPAVDLLGKADAYIAHLPAHPDGALPGHNKYDFDYSLGTLRPDLVVANFKLPVDEGTMRSAAVGNWAFTGQLYFNPIFRQHCLQHPVDLPTWRTIFVCDWSTEVSTTAYWRPLSER